MKCSVCGRRVKVPRRRDWEGWKIFSCDSCGMALQVEGVGRKIVI